MNKCRLTIKATHHFFPRFYYVLLHPPPPQVQLFLTPARLPSPTLLVPRKQHKWTHLFSATNASFVHITGFAQTSPNLCLCTKKRSHLWAETTEKVPYQIIRGSCGAEEGSRWDFSSNEGRLPGAGVWDRPSLTLACETIKAEEICHCRSTQRCEKREIKLEEDLFYQPCWDWSGYNPATICFWDVSFCCNTNGWFGFFQITSWLLSCVDISEMKLSVAIFAID